MKKSQVLYGKESAAAHVETTIADFESVLSNSDADETLVQSKGSETPCLDSKSNVLNDSDAMVTPRRNPDATVESILDNQDGNSEKFRNVSKISGNLGSPVIMIKQDALMEDKITGVTESLKTIEIAEISFENEEIPDECVKSETSTLKNLDDGFSSLEKHEENKVYKNAIYGLVAMSSHSDSIPNKLDEGSKLADEKADPAISEPNECDTEPLYIEVNSELDHIYERIKQTQSESDYIDFNAGILSGLKHPATDFPDNNFGKPPIFFYVYE